MIKRWFDFHGMTVQATSRAEAMRIVFEIEYLKKQVEKSAICLT